MVELSVGWVEKGGILACLGVSGCLFVGDAVGMGIGWQPEIFAKPATDGASVARRHFDNAADAVCSHLAASRRSILGFRLPENKVRRVGNWLAHHE